MAWVFLSVLMFNKLGYVMIKSSAHWLEYITHTLLTIIFFKFISPFYLHVICSFLFYFYWWEREGERDGGRKRERERERNTHLLFYLFMNSLVDSCMCHNWDWNSQPWCIRTILEQTELPDQDPCNLLLNVSPSSAPGRPALCDFAGVV